MKKFILGLIIIALGYFGSRLFFEVIKPFEDPNQATMPKEFLIKQIGDMPDGSIGLITKGAVFVDFNNKVWLLSATNLVEDNLLPDNVIKVTREGDYYSLVIPKKIIGTHKYNRYPTASIRRMGCYKVSRVTFE